MSDLLARVQRGIARLQDAADAVEDRIQQHHLNTLSRKARRKAEK